jgi:hypothetical protein
MHSANERVGSDSASESPGESAGEADSSRSSSEPTSLRIHMYYAMFVIKLVLELKRLTDPTTVAVSTNSRNDGCSGECGDDVGGPGMPDSLFDRCHTDVTACVIVQIHDMRQNRDA